MTTLLLVLHAAVVEMSNEVTEVALSFAGRAPCCPGIVAGASTIPAGMVGGRAFAWAMPLCARWAGRTLRLQLL